MYSMVTTITKWIPPDRFYHFINAWCPGLIFEISFLLLFYETLSLEGFYLNYFSVDPNLVFVLVIFCGAGLFGYILMVLGTIVTRLINVFHFKRSKKVCLDDLSKINERVPQYIYKEFEDSVIVQIFLGELSLIILVYALIFLFINPVNTVVFFMFAIFMLLLNFIKGKFLVIQYEEYCNKDKEETESA